MSSPQLSRPASPKLPSVFTDTKRAQTIPLDPSLLTAIDEQASKIGDDLENLMRVLQTRMEQAMTTTAASSGIHLDAVTELSSTIAESTAKFDNFLELVDKLDKEMEGMAPLAAKIKAIDKLLDTLNASLPPIGKR